MRLTTLSIQLGAACLLLASVAEAAITADIAANRVTGVAPLSVFFDATSTTSTTTSRPFHELDYRWDFGDPTAGNWNAYTPSTDSWGPGDRSKNLASGPVSSHVFNTPGTYSVTLNTRDAFGNAATKNVQIQVQDPDVVYGGQNTIVVSSTGNFAGAPAGALQITSNDFDDVVNTHASGGKRVLFRRGDTFSGDNIAFPSGSGGTIGSFGDLGNPKPMVSVDKANSTIDVGGASDWRIQDMDFAGSGGTTTNFVSIKSKADDILIQRTSVAPGTYNLAVSAPSNGNDLQGQDLHRGLTVVDNVFDKVGVTGGNIMFISGKQLAIQGNYLNDSRGGEHNLRVQHGEKGVISNNHFGLQASSKLLLTIRSKDVNADCSAGCGDPTREIVVADNFFVGSGPQSLGLVTGNSVTQTPAGRDLIVERNFFNQSSEYADEPRIVSGVSAIESTTGVTIRNNIVDMTGWAGANAFGALSEEIDVYNNTVYSGDANSNAFNLSGNFGDTDQGMYVFNNLGYAPNWQGVLRTVKGAATDDGNNVILKGPSPFVSDSPVDPADFQLKEGSLAIDAGAGLPVYRDYLFLDRPQAGAFDIGAYEYRVVPEPASALLLGLAAPLLGGRRRRA